MDTFTNGLFAFLAFFTQFIGLSSSTVPVEKPLVDDSTVLSKHPGKVANVFGWGYNRTSCVIEDKTILFFYAEDQHLYYTWTEDTSKYFLAHPEPQNPDFDIYCHKENEILITYSDPNQQSLFLTQTTVEQGTVIAQPFQKIYTGPTPYSAVAPHTQMVEDTTYVAFMEYGQGSGDENLSKVFVSDNFNGNWKTQKLFESSARFTQVLGISLEQYNNSLIAIISPHPGTMHTSVLNMNDQTWTTPKKYPDVIIRGHLEWQTLTDTQGVLHMIFRDDLQHLGYAQLKNDIWTITSYEGLGLNAFSMFRTQQNEIYVISNSGTVRKVMGNKLGASTSFKHLLPEGTELTFLRVPEIVGQTVSLSWLRSEGQVYHVFYKEMSLNELKNLPPIDIPVSNTQTITKKLY